MKKTIWILNHQAKDIQSINVIACNLSRLYKQFSSKNYEVKEIILSDDLGATRNFLLEYKQSAPEHIAIIHPNVTSHPFLHALLSMKSFKAPQFLFHLVGNFTRNAKLWGGVEHLLDGNNVHFFVPSSSYEEVIGHFIAKEQLSVLPFPVFDISEKPAIKNYSLKIFYAGRYHEQKNVTTLIDILGQYAEGKQIRVELTLASYFDDFNPGTLGKYGILGEQFTYFQRRLREKSSLLDIRFIPHQDKQHLKEFYRASDIFISLSTYFDEDYGYAVIESLAEGTPCIVSEWGGYKDFSKAFPNDCLGMKVFEEGNKLYLETSSFAVLVDKLLKQKVEKKLVEQYAGQERLEEEIFNVFSKNVVFKKFSEELKEFSSNKNLNFVKNIYKCFW